MSRVLLWGAEVTGVSAIAFGAWWRVDPLAGLVIAGLYLIVIANLGVNLGRPK